MDLEWCAWCHGPIFGEEEEEHYALWCGEIPVSQMTEKEQKAFRKRCLEYYDEHDPQRADRMRREQRAQNTSDKEFRKKREKQNQDMTELMKTMNKWAELYKKEPEKPPNLCNIL